MSFRNRFVNPTQLSFCLLLGLSASVTVGAAPNADQTESPVNFDSAVQAFDEQFQNGEFEACIDTGKWMLMALADMPNATSLERGAILAKLARAQHRAGRLEPAQQNYAAALDLISNETTHLDEQLEQPTWEYARLLDGAGDASNAAQLYERALHLHTVNNGVQSTGLADYLQEVSDFYMRIGDDKQARALQVYRVDLLRRQYGRDSLEILPALYDYAAMLEKTGDKIGAQNEYRDIMRRIVKSEGRRSHLMIPVTGRLANLFLYNEMYDGYDGVKQARRYYEVMMKIAERNEQATTAQKVQAFSGMGDYYTLKTNNAVKAESFYRKAWQAMAADPKTSEQLDEYFGDPLTLNDLPTVHSTNFAYWRDRVRRRGMKRGSVVVRYDVGTDGRMQNPRVVESEPYRFKDFLVVKQLRRFVHRPAMRDGEAVVSRDHEYRFEYAYWDHEYNEFLEKGIGRPKQPRTVAAVADK
ncbi:MAG: energy transducer TonB [Pseudomonadota bacterium]